jgi:hypothetical protein
VFKNLESIVKENIVKEEKCLGDGLGVTMGVEWEGNEIC